MAVSFARSNKKVLLIDADIRQPRLHKRFQVPASKSGLVDYLAGVANIEDVVVKHSEQLSLIPAGSYSPSPGELLGSQRMKTLIDEAKKQYDLVLLDSSPILPVADALILSNIVDRAITVVRSGRTKRRMAQEALKRLRRVGASILGVVLNDSDDADQLGNRLDAEYASSYYLVPEFESDDGRRIVGQD